MRRMYSESELRAFIRNHGTDVVQSLVGKDINVNEITSKGILNNGEMANNGDLTVFGDIIGRKINGTEIVELMSGYSFIIQQTGIDENLSLDVLYAGAVKNGNKLTLSLFMKVKRTGSLTKTYLDYALAFVIPKSVGDKIYPYNLSGLNVVDCQQLQFAKTYYSFVSKNSFLQKGGLVGDSYNLWLQVYGMDSLELDTEHYCRYEVTFLLSDNLIPQE